MSAAKGTVTSIQQHVLGKAGHTETVTAYTDLVGAGKLVTKIGGADEAAGLKDLLAEANYIGGVIDVGDLGDSANILGYTPFGSATESTLAGVAGLPEWTFTVALREDDSTHAAIRAARNGDRWEFVVATVTKFKTGEVEATVDYARGTLASKPKSFSTGDPSSMTVTVALDQAPTYYHEG